MQDFADRVTGKTPGGWEGDVRFSGGCLIDNRAALGFHANVRRTFYALGLLITAAVCFHAVTSPSTLPTVDPASPRAFDAALIARGEQLAAIGNCAVCHTAQDGHRLAGGRPILTPFGTIFSTNITPDPITGVGSWSEEAFRRAMREGISRDGHYLYPAFPYDHFVHVTLRDEHALYAYLMSRPPEHAVPLRNQVWFPLRMRRFIAVWNWFFLQKGVPPIDLRQSPEWNRGAYLVNGLGHCGSCHTPRNIFGAERADRPLSGGEAEGWDAYALDFSSPAPVAWTIESLAQFLTMGWHAEHGVARGPMAPVTNELGRAMDADVHAMATYIFSQMAARSSPQPQSAKPPTRVQGGTGADVFAASCAGCHDGTRPQPFGGIDFTLSSAINAPAPRNVVLVTLAGLAAADGTPSAIMPGFDGAMGDEQLVALLEYLRLRFSDKPPWSGLGSTVRAARLELRREARP